MAWVTGLSFHSIRRRWLDSRCAASGGDWYEQCFINLFGVYYEFIIIRKRDTIILDMKNKLPTPFKNAIIYDDKKLYACLANEPLVDGHVVVVWKKEVKDLNLLKRKDFEYLMDRVEDIRKAMIKALKVKKVYLLYMDEIGHVHWHLVPRYQELGIKNLTNKPGKIKDFTLDDQIRKKLVIAKQ